MKFIHNYNNFKKLYENSNFGNFEGSIKFTNWKSFKDKLENAINKGFSDVYELLSLMDMDKEIYDKIKNNMIYNWKDSVSKSLLHAVSNLGNEFPKEGDYIFSDLLTQTRFLILSSSGFKNNDMFGNSHSVDGLYMLSKFGDLERIKNTDPTKTKYNSTVRQYVMMKYVKVGGYDAYTTTKPECIEKVNDIIKYIWLYVFYNKYLFNKGLQNKTLNLPKYLYRGIRVGNVFSKANKLFKDKFDDIEKTYSNEHHTKRSKERMDIILNHIINGGLQDFVDGKFLSFTASLPIAKYFANKDGFILRVDSSKVDIITSELTDELFDKPDYVSGKKEREYIVRIPEDYKFTKDDIIISDTDYLVGSNSPLAVEYFDHDDKEAMYDLTDEKGQVWNIKARYVWHTNTSGGILYDVKKEQDEDYSWSESRKKIKQQYGIDPLPTENNLDKIKNFKINLNRKKW
jgi:hypothetical protein